MAILQQYQPSVSDWTFAYDPKAKYTYTIVMIPPPGIQPLAPNGFPAPPFPPTSTVSQAFIDAMIVRVRVFVDEQNCGVDVELDEDDPRSWHWVLYAETDDHDEDNEDSKNNTKKQQQQQQQQQASSQEKKRIPVSVIRIVPPPHGPHPNEEDVESNTNKGEEVEAPYVKLGRVATMKEWRGKGLSRRLIEEAFAWLSIHGVEEMGEPGWKGDVLCHAQVAVEKMYERVGFRTDDRLGRWIEEGIEHLGMWRRLQVDGLHRPDHHEG